MGYIEEPEGVDFIISGGHWTPEVMAEVADYIRNYEREISADDSKNDPIPSLPIGAEAAVQSPPLTSLSH